MAAWFDWLEGNLCQDYIVLFRYGILKVVFLTLWFFYYD